jgi:hypothetical protein
MDLGSIGGDLEFLARQFRLQAGGKGPQRLKVFRQLLRCQGHQRNLRRCVARRQPPCALVRI